MALVRRPFFDPGWLETGLKVLREYPAVAVGISPVDTVKRVSSRGFVVATPKRKSLVMIQTPQMFQTHLIQEAHERAKEEGWVVTDDTALMERMGHPVKILPGSRRNIKITEPDDLKVAEVILKGGEAS
jgi:2-C-methyl-D-erythritol 4-phosphate cytidylyltransferase